MPEPFKNLLNEQLIVAMSQNLKRVSDAFDSDRFEHTAKDGLADLEMMARADQISHALKAGLGPDFLANLDVLCDALHPEKTAELAEMGTDDRGIAGWAIVPMASYVARCGNDHPQRSLAALQEMTQRFSTEFAVRHFIRDHPELALKTAMQWAIDENHHVRRLASEGFRPLLPWGIKLKRFVDDPNELLPILTALRDDPSDYVRKSVANNLNDISKNQPDLVAELASEWLIAAPASRVKLVKHACRTLIKAGHPKALAAFGYGAPNVSNVILSIPTQVTLGDTVPIRLAFTSDSDQKLLVDYVLHFLRSNGNLSPKVFKWTETTGQAGEAKHLSKDHPYRAVTTRKDYPGQQIVSVQINGEEVARKTFEFKL